MSRWSVLERGKVSSRRLPLVSPSHRRNRRAPEQHNLSLSAPPDACCCSSSPRTTACFYWLFAADHRARRHRPIGRTRAGCSRPPEPRLPLLPVPWAFRVPPPHSHPTTRKRRPLVRGGGEWASDRRLHTVGNLANQFPCASPSCTRRSPRWRKRGT